MKTALIKCDVLKLRKNQLKMYVDQTVELIEMQGAQALHLDVEFNKLKALQPDLELLAAKFSGSYSESTQFKSLNAALNNVLRAMVLQQKSMERMQYVLKLSDWEMVSKFVSSYIKPAIPEQFKETVGICTSLLKIVAENAVLKTALELVGLKVHIEELERLVAEEASLRTSYLEKTTQREKSITTEMRSKVSKATSKLFKAIEVEREKFENVDYEPLVTGLNVMNSKIRSAQKSRSTRSSADQDLESETTVASSTKTTTTAA